jgi:membrane protein implicated in regulation of membrane protease activity
MIGLMRRWFSWSDALNPCGPTGAVGATFNVFAAGALILMSLGSSPMPWPLQLVFWLAFVGLAVRAWWHIIHSWRYPTFPEEPES